MTRNVVSSDLTRRDTSVRGASEKRDLNEIVLPRVDQLIVGHTELYLVRIVFRGTGEGERVLLGRTLFEIETNCIG